MKRRKYTLRQRAEQQQETRERIVDAAMALHEELGPAQTTIAALAERAGVQRLTVYRHFADEREILQACSSKWLTLHPPPDIGALPQAPPLERTRAALSLLYEYYRQTRTMWSSLYKDLGRLPALDAPMAQFDAYLDQSRKALLAGWAPHKSRTLSATLGHALRFSTWQSLSDEGLGRKAMTDLVCEWVQAAATG